MGTFIHTILHAIFVIVVNIIGWSMLVALIVGFACVFWVLVSGKNCGKLPWL